MTLVRPPPAAGAEIRFDAAGRESGTTRRGCASFFSCR